MQAQFDAFLTEHGVPHLTRAQRDAALQYFQKLRSALGVSERRYEGQTLQVTGTLDRFTSLAAGRRVRRISVGGLP